MALAKSPVLRLLLFVCGCLFLGLGAAGIIIRGLPTTPMLLLAAGCFSRSSGRMDRWLRNHPKLGPFLGDLQSGRGMPLCVKLYSLITAWILLGGFALFLTSSLHLRIFLFVIAAAKTVFLVWIIPTKTASGSTLPEHLQ